MEEVYTSQDPEQVELSSVVISSAVDFSQTM